MKSVSVAVLACLAASSAFAWEQHTPERVRESYPGTDLTTTAPYSSAGFVRTIVGKQTFSGSGAVAQDKRLLFTCAHLMIEKGRWSMLTGFRRAWDSEYSPDDSGTVFARGYYVFSSYTGTRNRGYDFDLDFAVAYAKAGEVFGPDALALNAAGPTDPDGLENLTSVSVQKTILGYPSYLDHNFEEGYYYMHQTGPFTGAGPSFEAFTQELGSYYGIDYVTTGPGNSGGPLLVRRDGDWMLAGILVSGSFRSAGIYAIDSYAKSLANSALADANGDTVDAGGSSASATARLTRPIALTDGTSKYSSLRIAFRGIVGRVTKVLLDLNITAQKKGDLDAYVRSPAGRIYVLASSDPATAGSNLVLDDQDISGAFSRTNPNGNWQVFVRDNEPNGFRTSVNSAGLSVTSL